ncbi:MAG: hypothetical protein QM784_02090 [Polyangiaceae bacterium]
MAPVDMRGSFDALVGGPFELLNACHALSDGNLVEVSAQDALKGIFPNAGGQSSVVLGTPSQETRFFDTVQQQLVRYCFYVSRQILDGSFLLDLAQNPRQGLPIVTLDQLNAGNTTIPVTDPLTIAEQLSIEYEKLRRKYVAVCAPFDEQSDKEKEATVRLLKERLIASCLNEPTLASKLSSRYTTTPADYLKRADKKRSDADIAREQAARHCILWLNGPLMTFARSTYGADNSVANWHPRIAELVKVDASVRARIADSYHGSCHIRDLARSPDYLIREFIGRPQGLNDSNIATVRSVGAACWDVISKLWISVGAVMAALASRLPTQRVDSNSVFTIGKLVTTYNTVFGDATLTVTLTKLNPHFVWKDYITGNVRDVRFGEYMQVELKDNRIIILSKTQFNSKNPFALPHFARGIALINLALAVGAAYEALVSSNSINPKENNTMTVVKLVGAIVDTGGAFPQSLAALIKATGRGVAFLGLASAVLSTATSFADATDAIKSGDYNATFGAALSGAGGVAAGVGFALVILNGGVVTPVPALLGVFGAVLAILGAVIYAIAKDSDFELLSEHVFLGKRHTEKDSQQPSWALAPYSKWDDPTDGLDHQIVATFNLLFAFGVTIGLSNTQIAHEELKIKYGTYAAGATFKVAIAGQIHKPVGPPEPFSTELIIDPADPNAARGTGSLTTGAVQVVPSKSTITIAALPAGLNVFAEVLENITWRILMNTGLNSVQTPSANPNHGLLVAAPCTVPASGKSVVVSGLGSAMSTEFA